ncbi:hypothetical protein LTR70_010022 [Exophiala xenobiotica]|uniref:DUF3074 domain-containing protein n=1 Tax=Lithohypha guttulata TaxID=1690604 RepID=A0ABR0JVP1_9EURO|nr:hypothetical protein LTR24_009988 [Lithohypha guttulata]KAK5309753.1 hypothetical protein LTR70_010022 [Exophiala xenobiotica]
MSVKSPMIRLAPVPFEDLPDHPSFGSGDSNKRPDLLRFALTLLDQGRSLVQPTQFNLSFKSHSQKSSPPSNNEIEILSATVPAADIEKLPWSSDEILRSKPANVEDEHWYARRSYHHNHPSKNNAAGTGSWQEFVYGLRDQHSKHEYDFSPSIYDARLICNWNEQINQLFSSLSRSESDRPNYTDATMAIYEMCHSLPSIIGPRCFPVLVITASCSADEFIAVTVPVDISSFSSSFYSNGRNRKEGADHQLKKSVTLGEYCAVERVVKYTGQTTHADKEGRTHNHGEAGEDIEWIMATASHARGNIPMAMQRLGIPGAVAKDVGLFLKWIHKVPDEQIRSQGVGTSTARP